MSQDLQTLYDEFNREYFSGVLPSMPVTYADLKAHGVFSCDIKASKMPFSVEMIEGTGSIKINSDYQEDVRGILLHEMIHAYFAVVGIATESHGPNFEAKRLKIEQESGISIPFTET